MIEAVICMSNLVTVVFVSLTGSLSAVSTPNHRSLKNLDSIEIRKFSKFRRKKRIFFRGITAITVTIFQPFLKLKKRIFFAYNGV